MSNELKPCPFCGLEDSPDDATAHEPWCYLRMLAENFHDLHYGNEIRHREEAMKKAYNTRAERTCHINWDKELFCFACDSCDHISMMVPDSRPTYCPNCGAKVVE